MFLIDSPHHMMFWEQNAWCDCPLSEDYFTIYLNYRLNFLLDSNIDQVKWITPTVHSWSFRQSQSKVHAKNSLIWKSQNHIEMGTLQFSRTAWSWLMKTKVKYIRPKKVHMNSWSHSMQLTLETSSQVLGCSSAKPISSPVQKESSG